MFCETPRLTLSPRSSSFISAQRPHTSTFSIFQPRKKNWGEKTLKKKQTSVALIVFFNYYYTFLQLDPADLAEQLKKQGASIPAVRPGRATAEHITGTLNRMSILGSAFLGALAAAPPLVEKLTGLTAFRGFAGTSLLILVGVATDTARKVKAEQVREGGEKRVFFLLSSLLFPSPKNRALSLFLFSFFHTKIPFSGDEQVPGHRQAVRRPQALERETGEKRERKLKKCPVVSRGAGFFSESNKKRET